MPMKLSEVQKSALLEAGNVGSGHAAMALSQLMGKKIMIALPFMEITELREIHSLLTDGGNKYVMVSLSVLGDIKGAIVLAIEEKMAFKLCDIVTGQVKGSTRSFNSLEQSALKEVGSIVSSSYMSAIGDMISMSIIVSIPDFYLGSSRGIEDVLAKKKIASEKVGPIMCIETELIEAEEKIDGYLIFVPTGDAIDRMVAALDALLTSKK